MLPKTEAVFSEVVFRTDSVRWKLKKQKNEENILIKKSGIHSMYIKHFENIRHTLSANK